MNTDVKCGQIRLRLDVGGLKKIATNTSPSSTASPSAKNTLTTIPGLGFQGPRGRRRERETHGPVAAFLQKGAVQHRGLAGSGVALFAPPLPRGARPGLTASHCPTVSGSFRNALSTAQLRPHGRIHPKQHDNNT